MEQVEHLPLPYFKIDENYRITAMSEESKLKFLHGDGLMSLVDEGSQEKAARNITPEIPVNSIELVLKTKNDPAVAFQLDIKWFEKEGHIICQEPNTNVGNVSRQLQGLRDRLAETDFALLEKKEELEQAIDRADKLSGPFIPLSKEVAVVPLFGDLSSKKLHSISGGIVDSLYHSEFHYILFDFTVVGEISRSGMAALEELIKTIGVMGQDSIICGVKPLHAQMINDFKWLFKSKKINKLSDAVRMYVGKSTS
ncbi:STAS domain-containing protein [Sediminibacillus massiliensis]|uniref:STAS domain-containing protein n=1 Tax=Sediminibacillus massiliensis TaxID=1926277 RepID=UPI000988830D|nr:STAS domain-containing protein [Sediminibacillus massiliensis]